MSYGHRGTGRTHLNDVAIIGEDALGVTRSLPVAGFTPVDVFNSPLQIRQQEAVLFLAQAPPCADHPGGRRKRVRCGRGMKNKGDRIDGTC